MSTREINIFQIARTSVDTEAVRAWLDCLGAHGHSSIPADHEATDPAFLVALAARRCYNSFEPGLNPNVTRVRREMVDYIDNILKQGHGSVLEHAVYSFAIEGVSRVFTAEMNRHKAGTAISEASLRFIRFEDDIPYWLPFSIRPNDKDLAAVAAKKEATCALFEEVFQHVQQCYADALKLWDIDNLPFDQKKKVTSMLRRMVPMGVSTGGVWSGNLRAVRHMLALRTDPGAEEEIQHVFEQIGWIMVNQESQVFQDFKVDPDTGAFIPKYRKV